MTTRAIPPAASLLGSVVVMSALLHAAHLAHAADAADADGDRAYCEAQQGSARAACLRGLEAAAPAADARAAAGRDAGSQGREGDKPTRPGADGMRVDADASKGFQTWRAAACDRCHGADLQGLVGPSLIAGLKSLSKEDFEKVVAEGRMDKGMPAYKDNRTVMDNLDPLYAYLKGRADGTITRDHVQRSR